MKVSLGTIEITDEQRVLLANVLDNKVSKRKATRNEAKDFIWSEGADWPEALHDQYRDLTEGEASEPEGEDKDEDDELESLL